MKFSKPIRARSFTPRHRRRILESAARLKQGGFLTPILVGNVDDVKAAAKAGNFDIEGLEIIDPANYDKMDEMLSACLTCARAK